MNELIWTSEKPTAPGWYWCRFGADDKHPEVVQAYEVFGKLCFDQAGTEMPFYPDSGHQFAGPIPEPAAGHSSGMKQEEWANLTEAMTIQFIAGELVDMMVPFAKGKERAMRLRDAGSQEWHNTFRAMGGALIALEKMGYSVIKK